MANLNILKKAGQDIAKATIENAIPEQAAKAAKKTAAAVSESEEDSRVRYSGWMSKKLWSEFTNICKNVQNVPNNAMINILVSDFVRKNRDLLD